MWYILNAISWCVNHEECQNAIIPAMTSCCESRHDRIPNQIIKANKYVQEYKRTGT